MSLVLQNIDKAEIIVRAMGYGILKHSKLFKDDNDYIQLSHQIEDWEEQLQLAEHFNIDWESKDYDPQTLDILIEEKQTNCTFAKEIREHLYDYYNKLGV